MKIILNKNEEKRVRSGHPWIFSNEIAVVEGFTENGLIGEFYTSSGALIGVGFYNKNSLIAGRILSFNPVTDVEWYIKQRLTEAWEFRRQVWPGRESFRLCHSESDQLPGLIIDKYNNTYAAQCNTAGMFRLCNTIVSILVDEFGAENIIGVNDARLNEMEGITGLPDVLHGTAGTEIISDGILKFKVDFLNSQKTGFFLDQAENRKFGSHLFTGVTVLDAYCNSGGFGIHALYNNAKHVDFIDISAGETENVAGNIALNFTDTKKNYTIIKHDVFEYLENMVTDKKFYDVVMVDPPSFAKSRKSVPAALKAYQKMHRLALGCIKPGGYLFTSSCSHHIDYYSYLQTVLTAAGKLGVGLQLIHQSGAAPDHPVLPQMPETEYLKFLVFRVRQKNNY